MDWIPFALIAVLAIQFIVHSFEKKSMQKTIDRLTDKVMARDYSEFKRHNAPSVMQEEKGKRKPMSFYDDVNVTEDEIRG